MELGEKYERMQRAMKELEILRVIKEDRKFDGLGRLLSERELLERENKAMREFLLKFGMKWVGGNGNKVEPEYKPNMEIIARRIEELNILAENDNKSYISKDGAHQFIVCFYYLIEIGSCSNRFLLKWFNN